MYTACKDAVSRYLTARIHQHQFPNALIPNASRANGLDYTTRARLDAGPTHNEETPSMLHYAVVFLVIALIAAVFGFTGIAAGAASIAKILFVVFIILFVLSLIFGGFRRGPRI